MFVFAHTGLTLGIATVMAGAFVKKKRPAPEIEELESLTPTSPRTADPHVYPGSGPASWLATLAERVDIRILLIGSLLPDIIDKPIGRFFFKDTFNNGRIFSHTLLFLVVLIAGGLILYLSRRKNWLLVLAFGTFLHLVMDGMWTETHTLFWPLYGFSFPKYPLSAQSWLMSIWHSVTDHPWYLIPELLGLVIIAWFLWQLVRRKKFFFFLRYGLVSDL
jgi:inner membrane protein